MKPLFALAFLTFMPAFAAAQEGTEAAVEPEASGIFRADATDLNEFIWINRPVVVFADSPADPRYVEQMQNLVSEADTLAVRDVVVLTDTDPAADSALREKLHPRGFMLVLIGKDGMVKLRKPVPWDVRELSRVIDKMPMRQQEMRDRRGKD